MDQIEKKNRKGNRPPIPSLSMIFSLCAWGVAGLLSSCVALPSPDKPVYSLPALHTGEHPLSITIRLEEQRGYLYRGDLVVSRFRVATGIPGYETPTGTYSILEKSRYKRSNLYGEIYDANGRLVNDGADARRDPVPRGGRFSGADMPFWMRLTNDGIGMHAGPIPYPGYPASHGCIRLPRPVARLLFSTVPKGAVVRIRQ